MAEAWYVILLRVAVLVFFCLLLTRLFHRYVIKSALRERLKVIFFSLYSLAMILILFEFAFMFVARTSAIFYTLSSRNWFARYWHENRLGFRDDEPTANDHRKKVLVIGDSFTEGYGIESPKDRFSDVLQNRLGKDYKVYNLGKCGADSRQEYQTLTQFPAKPDLLVLQYFGNDNEGVLDFSRLKKGGFHSYNDWGIPFNYLARGSYFLNYVYWKLPHPGFSQYADFVKSAYKDKSLVKKHEADLQKFVDYSHTNHIPLVVVMFPQLNDLKASQDYVPEISRFFASKGAFVMDVTPAASVLPKYELTVNAQDAHPSIQLHHWVGNQLFDLFHRNALLKQDKPTYYTYSDD